VKIKIDKLKLRNFKGIKELEIDFNGRDTNIYGRNATGKTTIFDAFKWLFFDKDSNDRTKFNVKTLDKDNKPIHYLEHEVEATLIIDGQNTIFRRVLKEKWVKKRGQEKEEYGGTDESFYWIDEVPVKQKEYLEKVNDTIPEIKFKLLTDPLYFNNQMSWKDRRELLINISKSNITDEQILNSNEQFNILKENLQGRNIEEYQKIINEKIKKLENDKECIPIRIDELTKTLITEYNIDYEKIEKEREKYNEELQKIDVEMTDIQARAKENMKKADELVVAKNELNNLKFKLETENSNKNSVEQTKLTNEKLVLETKIRANQLELEERKQRIKQDEMTKKELYKEWDKVNNTKLKFDENLLVCPTCKREYEGEKAEKLKETFTESFNKHKEDEKVRINSEGQAINERLEENNTAVVRLQNAIDNINNDLNEVKNRLEELEKQKINEEMFDVTSNIEYKEKSIKVEQLQQEVEKLASKDTTELQTKKVEIVEKINNIDKQLNERDIQDKTKARIEELEMQEKEMSQKIQDLEAQQYQIEQFTKVKVELLENTINSKFEFVKFRLFEKQKNGGTKECCDTLVNGVPYTDVNNAHKILAGLDIINTLIKFYNTSAPIFIDNRESINEIYNIDTQIINLIVTNDKELRIELL